MLLSSNNICKLPEQFDRALRQQFGLHVGALDCEEDLENVFDQQGFFSRKLQGLAHSQHAMIAEEPTRDLRIPDGGENGIGFR